MALKFKLLGMPIVIGMDFFIIMLFLGVIWQADASELPAWMVVVTLSVLCHEMGHAVFFDFFGVKPAIYLHGGGGLTIGRRLPPAKQIVVAAAGPCTGLLIGGIVGVAAMSSAKVAASPIVQDVLWVNLGWSLINLLPLPGGDGGTIVNELVTLILGRPAEMVGRTVGLVLTAAVLGVLLLLGFYDLALIVGFFAVFWFVRMGMRRSATSAVASSAIPPAQLIIDGRYLDAFNAARVAMADHPADLEPVLTASDALRLIGKYGDAEWGYSKVIDTAPTNTRALRGRAYVRRRLGRAAEADADLAALLRLPADAAVAQAAALYDANRLDAGLRLANQGLGIVGHPVMMRALKSFVVIFEWALGREADALAHIEELIREMPERADLREQRVLILIDMGRFEEARHEMRQALALKPQHPEYHETFGIVERMAGNPGAALQPLTFSATARSGDPRARSELIACQAQLGMVGDARAALETLPGYALHDPFVAYARATLAVTGGADDQAVAFLAEAQAQRPHLGLRAGVDPMFRSLLSDRGRRAALSEAATNTAAVAAVAASQSSGTRSDQGAP